MPLLTTLSALHARIAAAEKQYGRTPGAVTLLAVSKTQAAAAIEQLLGGGQKCYGENYLREALPKISTFTGRGIEWHYIGPIQSNKTRAIALHFDWVHSVARLSVAQRLNDQRPAELGPLNICLQVNISGEHTKAGVIPADLPALAHALAKLPHLRLRGLMTVPAPVSDFNAQRLPFAHLRHLYEQLGAQGLTFDTLSMGMSTDLEAAIAEGATMVRVGTALFGARVSASRNE